MGGWVVGQVIYIDNDNDDREVQQYRHRHRWVLVTVPKSTAHPAELYVPDQQT